MAFGLDSSGFEPKTQTDIETEIQSYMQSEFLPSYQLRTDTADGQIFKITAWLLARIWQMLQLIYFSFIPSYAEGVQLDNICEYNDITRLPESKSSVELTVVGTNGTTIPSGSIVSVIGTQDKFQTIEDITIGISGTATVMAESINPGAIVALAETITVIETPISGWTSVTNLQSATLGNEEETDSELRMRRFSLLSATGFNSEDAIKAGILSLDNVKDCSIKSNVEDTTDGDGRPPHSFEAIVWGGDSDEIAETIWDKKPAGIQPYGVITKQIYDSTGTLQTIKYTNPTEINVFVQVQISTNSYFPINGEDLIKEAIAEYLNTNTIGSKVIRSKLYSIIFSIAGVTDISILELGKNTSATSESDVTIAYDEVAVSSTDYISISII